MHSQAITYSDVSALLDLHSRLVVCTIVRAQGSVPRRPGSRMVVLADGQTFGTVGGGLFEALVATDARQALIERRSRTKRYDFREVGSSPDAFGAICGGSAEIFLEVVTMPERLLIVGGGHCGRALAQAAALLGEFEVVVVDDRPEYAAQDSLPPSVTVELLPAGFSGLSARINGETYVALVSQGAATDQSALRQVVELEIPYIGMMGSRKKVRTVLDALATEGLSAEALARVHAPIGLDIHAETPAEIAVAVLAEIISVRAGVRSSGKP